MDDALALCVPHSGPVACVSTHYDVFLSFPGGSGAAPASFPGRLNACLAAAGVSVCGSNKSQGVGSSSQLPDEAVWRSKICVPILSEDYASSERCLHRLVQMMDGSRSARQMALLIFNRVEPSQVRYLKGSFEKGSPFRYRGSAEVTFRSEYVAWMEVTDGYQSPPTSLSSIMFETHCLVCKMIKRT